MKNGFFNGERPDYHYGDESKSFIPWHDSTVCKPVKNTSSSTDKPKKPRICSLCKCAGHTKRTCPTLKKVEESSPAPATEPEPAAVPAAVSAPETEPEPETAAEPETEPEPETAAEPETEPAAELDEDLSEGEEEGETIDCTYEGVPYTRNSEGEVFDDDFEVIGSWVDGSIKFTRDGGIAHMNSPHRS